MFSKRLFYSFLAGILLTGESEAMFRRFLSRIGEGSSSVAAAPEAASGDPSMVFAEVEGNPSADQKYIFHFFKYTPSEEERSSGNIPTDAFAYHVDQQRQSRFDSGNRVVVLKANSPGIGLVKDRVTDKPRIVLMNGPSAYDEATERLLAQFSINSETGEFTVTAAENAPVSGVTALKAKKASQLAARTGLNVEAVGSNMFRIVRGNEGHFLQVGDVLKLGGTWLRVHQMGTDENDAANIDIIPEQSEGSIAVPVAEDEPTFDPAEGVECYFCTEGPVKDTQEWEPLAKPCGCSMYSHRDCLQKWRKSRWDNQRRNSVDTGVRSINDQKCEVCHSQYSMYMSKDDEADKALKRAEMAAARARGESVDERDPRWQARKVYYPCMHSAARPKVRGGQFIIFENLSAMDETRGGARILTVPFTGGREGAAIVKQSAVAALGRNYEHQIAIQGDPTLSDHHSTVQLYRNRFVIRDHDSKYGTLVKLPNVFSKQIPVSNSPAAAAARSDSDINMDTGNARVSEAQRKKKRITFQIQIEDVLFDAERVY